jgi:hypothetical protein
VAEIGLLPNPFRHLVAVQTRQADVQHIGIRLAELLRASTQMAVTIDRRPQLLPPNSQQDVALYCGWYSPGKYVPCVKFVSGAVGSSAPCMTRTRPLMFLAACALLLGWRLSCRRGPGELRVTFLSVGHGTCAVLETPDGKVLLYDIGTMAGPDRISSGSAPPMVTLSVIGFVPGFTAGLDKPDTAIGCSYSRHRYGT